MSLMIPVGGREDIGSSSKVSGLVWGRRRSVGICATVPSISWAASRKERRYVSACLNTCERVVNKMVVEVKRGRMRVLVVTVRVGETVVWALLFGV